MRIGLLLVPLGLIAACATASPPLSSRAASSAVAIRRAPSAIKNGDFLSSDGVSLHYLDAGRGTPIVFVPGWDMPGWIFQAQIVEFSRSYRVIAFDPRGQGASEIPTAGYEPHRRGRDIAELIGHLHTGPVILVGWSLGVLDSLAAIADQGDSHIAALVLIDNSVGEAPVPTLPVRRPRARRKARPIPREVAMRSFVASMFQTVQPRDYLDQLTAAALRVPAPASAALLAYPVPRSFWYNAVYATKKPILYVVRPGLAGQARNLQSHHPDTESIVLPHVGHALFVDDPNRFNALLLAFLRRHGL